MNVILKQTLRGLGKLGETVRVRPGYARNFLIPRDLALLATDENAEAFAAIRAHLEKEELKRQSDFDLAADKINELGLLEIAMRASEEGKLYGAVTAREVVGLLDAKGIAIHAHQIIMPQARIREVGEYTIDFLLTEKAKASCNLLVLHAASDTKTVETTADGE